MRCRALALIGLLAAGVVVACQATPPCTPAGCPDRFSARFEVEPSIFVLNGGSMSLCRGEVCVTAQIRFDDLDGGFPLSVNCPVRPPPTIAGPTVDCGNELIEPSKQNYVENVILVEYRAPQQATPIEKEVFTVRLTDAVGRVVAERAGTPVYAKPNPAAASCNPYCTEAIGETASISFFARGADKHRSARRRSVSEQTGRSIGSVGERAPERCSTIRSERRRES